MTNHHHNDPNTSGAIPPIPPTRDEAGPPARLEGAANALTIAAAISAILALWCAIDHSNQATTAIVVFIGCLGAAVITKQHATNRRYDHDRRATSAGLRDAIRNEMTHQVETALAELARRTAAQHEATIAAVRQELATIHDEITQLRGERYFGLYNDAVHDLQRLGWTPPAKNRTNGVVPFHRTERTNS